MINLTLIRVNPGEYGMVNYDEIQIIYFKVSIEKIGEKRETLLGFMMRYKCWFTM